MMAGALSAVRSAIQTNFHVEDTPPPPPQDESADLVPTEDPKPEKPPREYGHKKLIKIVSNSSPSNFWSRTFAFTTFPLILCGFPSYILLKKSSSSQVNSVRKWVRHLFDFRRPILTLLTCILLLYSVLLNLLLLRFLVRLFQGLFIRGEGGRAIAGRLGLVVLYLPEVVAVDYFWVFGYKVKLLIDKLDAKHGRHSHVACGWYRSSLAVIVTLLVGVFFSRYWRHGVDYFLELSAKRLVYEMLQFSNYVFLVFTFPIYCTFCFGIRFELLIIKTFLYEQIRKRITPNVNHVDRVKRWFTQAADHIVFVNHMYWCLLAVVICIMFYDIFDEAPSLMKLLATYTSIFKEMIQHKSAGDVVRAESNATLEVALSSERGKLSNPEYAKKVYADVVWVALTCSIIFYTIWQAVLTNDAVKHVQNWINDFSMGGGGADVPHILKELTVRPKEGNRKDVEEVTESYKVVMEESNGTNEKEEKTNGELKGEWKENVEDVEKGDGDKVADDYLGELEYESESEVPLLWSGQKNGDDQDYEDMFMKVMTLKNYITVRIKLENPALLSIMLFGIVPGLKDRLQGYKL